ncbi:MAG: family 16 glycoside hydrolase [Tepidisphaerales bacterium]
MFRMFSFVLGLICMVSPALAAEDWVSLFDGKTLDGWKVSENPASFKVVDGAIVCNGPRAHAFYAGPVRNGNFKNFEFKADVLTAPGANSGIYFHTKYQETGFPGQGYEAQIDNTEKQHGNYYEFKKTGSLYGIRNQYKAVVNDNEWFTMHIVVRGKHIQVRINDAITADYIEPARPLRGGDRDGRVLSSGTFALQGHDPDSKASFKNIMVKPLPDDLAADVDGPVPAEEPYPDLLQYHMSNFPLIDLHSHLKGGLTLDDVLLLSRKTGINFGIAPNCGIGFPITDDKGIYDFVAALKGKPVFVGMQAEGREWVKAFSAQAIAQFDYVFTDAMTFTDDRTGKRTRLWVDGEFEVGDKQQFMDMLVGKIQGIVGNEPIDIYVNATFLPKPIADEYDQLWTRERMQKVADALAKNGVAMEISARYKIPSAAMIKIAKQAGVKFTFGTNNAGKDDLGVPDYCLRMVKECGLTSKDFFIPSPDQPKAIQRKGLPK